MSKTELGVVEAGWRPENEIKRRKENSICGLQVSERRSSKGGGK